MSDHELENFCNGDIPGGVIRLAARGGAESDRFILSALRWLVGNTRMQPLPQCEALLAAAMFLHRRGVRLEHALEAAVTATAIATRAGLDELILRARMASGIVMAAQDNLGGAIELFVDALDHAQRIGDRMSEQKAWNNIGSALSTAGDYRDASEAFRRSLTMAERHAPDRLMGETWANVAYCALQQADLSMGLDAIRRAVSSMTEGRTPGGALARCYAESTYVRLLLLAGSLDEARERAGRMPHLASRASSVKATLLVRSVDALIKAYCGEHEAAQRLAMALVEEARYAGAEALVEQLQVGVQIVDADANVALGVHLLRELAVALLTLQRSAAQRMQAAARHLRNGGHGAVSLLPGAGDPHALLESIALMPELQGRIPAGHLFRVGRLSALVAIAQGYAPADAEALERSARLHDIGLAAMPDYLLRRVGHLSAGETAILHTHPTAGGQIIDAMGEAALNEASRVAWFHHERWDGTGYPQGLAGRATPREARIVATANLFDNLTHGKAPHGLEVGEALQALQREAGHALDPDIAEAAGKVVIGLLREHGDLDAYLGEAASTSTLAMATRKVRQALTQPAAD